MSEPDDDVENTDEEQSETWPERQEREKREARKPGFDFGRDVK